MSGSFDGLTVREAAQLIGISPSILARWADNGRIPFSLGPAGQRLFNREDIERLSVIPESKPDEDEA